MSELVFGCRDEDPLALAFIAGLHAGGVTVTQVIDARDAMRDAALATAFLGGFSRGARLAAELANDVDPRGLVLLGYPFHPKGRPQERSALAVLAQVAAPSLVLQGERDAYGNRQAIGVVSERVAVTWLPDGNHRWVPRAASGLAHDDLMARAVTAALTFMRQASR